MINTKRLTFALALLAIIIGAAFLRFENLGQQSYWMDEGYTVNAVITDIATGSQVTIIGTPNSDGSINATSVQLRPTPINNNTVPAK